MDQFDKQHAEIMGYLHAVSLPPSRNLLCKFFKSNGDTPYCTGCVFEITNSKMGNRCWLTEISKIANEKLDIIEEKNLLKVDDEYKGGFYVCSPKQN